MPDYEKSLQVSAPAAEVFEYVSEPANLPHYLPTVKHAEAQGAGRIRVKGEAQGHSYDSDGDFEVDKKAQKMRWSSDGERDYRGELTVSGDGSKCEVTVTLHFGGDPKIGSNPEPRIEDGLTKALQSIQNQVEGKGGKQDQH